MIRVDLFDESYGTVMGPSSLRLCTVGRFYRKWRVNGLQSVKEERDDKSFKEAYFLVFRY